MRISSGGIIAPGFKRTSVSAVRQLKYHCTRWVQTNVILQERRAERERQTSDSKKEERICAGETRTRMCNMYTVPSVSSTIIGPSSSTMHHFCSVTFHVTM